MSEPRPVIRMEKVSKAFGSLVVLDEIDLAIEPGKATVILGPSGSGKSVLLKHTLGLLRPDSGRVFFEDTDVSGAEEKNLIPVRRQFGFLFQGGALFDSMTVEGNICFPMSEHAEGDGDSRKKRCKEVLAMVGLDGLQDRYPEELSGGQQKRVALARAIVLEPKVVLYDEPTTGLDPIRADLINELILRLQSALGVTSLVVTHDMDSARKIADRILMLYKGRFITDTTPERLDQEDNDVFRRFVEGRASEEELQQIQSGPLSNTDSQPAERDDADAEEPQTQRPSP